MNTQTTARTLAQVNKAIAKNIDPLFYLVKGEGYFYVVSDDPKSARQLSSLESPSIYIYALNRQTIERWVEDVRRIVDEAKKDDGAAFSESNFTIKFSTK